MALRAGAALGGVGFDLQAANGPHGLLMDRVLHAQKTGVETEDLQLSRHPKRTRAFHSPRFG